ncbi:hypothetical protein R2F25_09350 [Streptomyces sp. UP1A-1]|nr:hypothetical protein [Streptomyces sp. UP1A-1]
MVGQDLGLPVDVPVQLDQQPGGGARKVTVVAGDELVRGDGRDGLATAAGGRPSSGR